MKKQLVYPAFFLLLVVAGCGLYWACHAPQEEYLPEPAIEAAVDSIPLPPPVVLSPFDCWLKDSISKDFLMGKVNRHTHPMFAKVTEEHTERKIYLLKPVYEAYIKMYEAALADGVRLVITSGHRTFVEQVCEWELRWNNPLTDEPFRNDTEKARFLLQYRSMPGTSRHHWGTDIDLNSFRLSYFETNEGRKLYEWLHANAHRFGFFQPYTAQDENRPTGYCEEKWHWSYRPIAQEMLTHYLRLIEKKDIKGFKGDKAAQHLNIITDWVCGINGMKNS